MEKKSIEKGQLVFEFRFFKKLNAEGKSRQKGIPRIYYFGPCGLWHALVMDLLGPSLESVHEKCGRIFTLKTTLLLTKQLIEIYEYFHSKGLVYRDTKPENFLFGRSGTDLYSCVHIIDLGLSKEYLDESGKHIPFIDGKGMTGTARYMSINNHLGREQSRRDDLEALGYMLVYFLKGELPWQGLKGENIRQKYRLIAEVKQKTKPETLCEDIPKEFYQYFIEIKALEFDENPKYKRYLDLFSKLYKNKNFKNDNIYDFDRNHRPRN